jgi:hypothetical protein
MQAPQDALAQAAMEIGPNPGLLTIRCLAAFLFNSTLSRRPFDPTTHDLEANFRLTRCCRTGGSSAMISASAGSPT